MENGEIELVITQEVGPRVIRAGFLGKQNLFKEFADQLGKIWWRRMEDLWGHRLWHAPKPYRNLYS